MDNEYLFSFMLGKKIAEALDDNNIELANATALVLGQSAPELILITLRNEVGLERIVKHNLDNNKIFSELLNKMMNRENKHVC